MDIKQLRCFIAVAEHLNFSRASESLYISQPALSYQIAELEKELGCSLLVRDKRKVYLTPAGGALLPMAQRTIASVQDILLAAQAGFPNIETFAPLRIGMDKTEDHFESTGITRLIARFQMDYPDIPVDMTLLSFSECVQRMLQDELDVGCLVLRHNESLPPDLTYKVVHMDRLYLVWSKGISFDSCEDLCRNFNIILASDHPRGESRILHALEGLGAVPSVITADSIPVSFTLMQAGKGAIILPGNYIWQHQYSDISYLEIPTDAAEISHVIAWNRYCQNPSIQLLVNSFDDIRRIHHKTDG